MHYFLTDFKVVQIIKCTYTVFIDNFGNISTNTSIYVSVCRGSYKRNDSMYEPWDSQGNEKNAVSISVAFCLDFFIGNENITSQKYKTKKSFEKILHVGPVTSVQNWVTKRSCHG